MSDPNTLEQARKQMHHAEDALKYYALSGGKDLEEYARLLDAAKAARNEFLDVMCGGASHNGSSGTDALHRSA